MICLNLAVSYNMRLNESMHVYIIQGSEPVGPIHLFEHYVPEGSLSSIDKSVPQLQFSQRIIRIA